MKDFIHAISDTHNQHGKLILSGGHILVHAGDMSGRGTPEEILQFINWFEQQNYIYKLLIPGNHDWDMERNFPYWLDECSRRGITLLNDSGTIIDGINVWGSPVQPWFHDWAYNRHRGASIKAHWDLIPKNTEIIITHGPPAHILDDVPSHRWQAEPEFTGCEDLLAKILETDIKLHIFGHIHENRGVLYQDNRAFVNACSLNRMYFPYGPNPIRITRLPDAIYVVEE
jgi:hypothetical protein